MWHHYRIKELTDVQKEKRSIIIPDIFLILQSNTWSAACVAYRKPTAHTISADSSRNIV